MRKFVLTSAAVLMTVALISEPGVAAKKRAAAPVRSYDSCVQLALSRGFTYSDLTQGTTKAEVKTFIKNCMSGKQV
jgi:hypothetical protein